MHVQRETAEEYSQHYGTTFDTAFVEREYAVPEFSTKVRGQTRLYQPNPDQPPSPANNGVYILVLLLELISPCILFSVLLDRYFMRMTMNEILICINPRN